MKQEIEFSAEVKTDKNVSELLQTLAKGEIGLLIQKEDGRILNVARITKAEDCPQELFEEVMKKMIATLGGKFGNEIK